MGEDSRAATVSDVRQLLDEACSRLSKEIGELARRQEEMLQPPQTSQSNAGMTTMVAGDLSVATRTKFCQRPGQSQMSSWNETSERLARFDMRQALGHEDLKRRSIEPAMPISWQREGGRLESMEAWKRVLYSPTYEYISGLFIVLNACLMGKQAEMRAQSVFSAEEVCQSVHNALEVFFAVGFTFELAWRMLALRKDFFCGDDRRWNWFDTIVILATDFEEVYRHVVFESCEMLSGASNSIGILRVLRLLRLVRIVKIIRVLSFFRELRVMVESIFECLIPMVWALVLLGLIQWIFAVYFLDISTDHVRLAFMANATAMQDTEVLELRQSFGSIAKALQALFQSLTGGRDWGPTADLLLATGSKHAVVLFYFYIALTSFAVINVFTGIFVESAIKRTSQDRDLTHQDLQGARGHFLDQILQAFREADKDASGAVTFAEFDAYVSDPRVQTFFQSLELEVAEARRLFRLLDIDSTGSVDAEEFVLGCLCLKGSAKAMDVAALLIEVKQQAKTLALILGRLDSLSLTRKHEEHEPCI